MTAKEYLEDKIENTDMSLFNTYHVAQIMEEYAALKAEQPQWIKINSEYDLPKIPTNSWVITEKKNVLQFSFYISHPSICDKEEITHYMPITKPQPPKDVPDINVGEIGKYTQNTSHKSTKYLPKY